MLSFKLRGTVREAETLLPLPGLWVKAYDKDLLFDDLLGTVETGELGEFEIVAEPDDFREFFATRPDIYLKIYAPDRETVIHTTRDAIRWRAGRNETFDVLIPRRELGDSAPEGAIRITADDDSERTDFDVGEPLTIELVGVRPSAPHEIVIEDETGRPLFVDRLISNARGVVEPTVIWPQMGLDDPSRPLKPTTLADAAAEWTGRRLTIRVRHGKHELWRDTISFADVFSRPLVLSTDADGHVLNGFEVGKHDATVTLHNMPFVGDARVYLVPRQYDWHAGDGFHPVSLASGRAAHVDVTLASAPVTAIVAQAGELAPGAYDFVVRSLRYGYEDDDDFTLRPTDVLGGRRVTGLVVRKEFWSSKVIRGGCTNLLDIAGRSVGDAPYMQITDVFQVGENIYGALDPAALDPNHTSKMVALYVVPHKTAAQWTADNSLNHLAVLGGNPAVQTFQTQSWCVNANRRLLWPNATQVGEYDIVADFGNNVPDAGSFVADAHYNMPLDIIDGYVQAGFRVVPDTTTDTSFGFAGHFSYDQTTQGTYHVTGDESLGTLYVPRKASVYFPADVAGATTVAQVSAVPPASYPIVLVAHGNGADTGYLGYEYLLAHLARNGFIAASIYLTVGMGGTGRAQLINTHLNLLKALFGAKAQNKIGLMGHSRGGEAVCIAARLNQQLGWGHGLNALISLAPTDQYTHESLGGAWATPYLCMYGSMDGDVASVGNNGFRLYDRASGAEKSFVFVYGAIHDRFNTVWGDGDLGFSKLAGADFATVITADAHQKIAKGYMSAFFRRFLKNETQWTGIFRGEWVPVAAATADSKAKFYVQYQHPAARTVDDFEGAHSPTTWQSSTIGGTVGDGGTLAVPPNENQLPALDTHSPHDTAGLLLRWDNVTDRLMFNVPAGQRDVRGFAALQFRITQKVNSGSNPAGLPQDLRVSLTDTASQSRAIMVSKFGAVPPPHRRVIDMYTKSAMNTVRIPLSAFRILCLTVQEVDLANVATVAFEFTELATGEIEIDSVQFTN